MSGDILERTGQQQAAEGSTTLSDIQDRLKRAGLKVTQPRIRILQILEQKEGRHASAEEIYRLLVEQNEDVGVATIYRVLTQCEQAGLVKRLQFEGGKSVFELTPEHHHDHIICVRCGRVEEFHDEVIEARQREIADQAGFGIEDHSMILYGLCADCRRQSADRRAQR
ncbi:MAG TPA: ferric iron uptake transcriptional regulator [Sedimenticola thiotaurini]|uniref:Ferric uptake regulation protein n=1 Tax=Sedimenticola thiotaurini TaxID=1543721 RepID=A0A831RMP9_9GAMM|nr:ferric iron uptake transcriptional regulator [Sedimenticola thiotaurini]